MKSWSVMFVACGACCVADAHDVRFQQSSAAVPPAGCRLVTLELVPSATESVVGYSLALAAVPMGVATGSLSLAVADSTLAVSDMLLDPPEQHADLSAILSGATASSIQFHVVSGDGSPRSINPGNPNALAGLYLVASEDASGLFEIRLAQPSVLVSDVGVVLPLSGVVGQVTIAPCVDASVCCDPDGDGVRNWACEWCACTELECQFVARTEYADIGGSFGTCPPDGFCNIHDRTHALNCFSGTNPCDEINIDVGGAWGNCVLDGFCNIHDANHALNCFSGSSTCDCTGSDAYRSPTSTIDPTIVGATVVRAVSHRRTVQPGHLAEVRVFVDSPIALQSYQLTAAVSGGQSGQLDLIEARVFPRADHVFVGSPDEFEACNLVTGQLIKGLDNGNMLAAAAGYLGTFVYRASPDAAGEFVVDILHSDPQESVLVSAFVDKVDITATVPAVIRVQPASLGTEDP